MEFACPDRRPQQRRILQSGSQSAVKVAMSRRSFNSQPLSETREIFFHLFSVETSPALSRLSSIHKSLHTSVYMSKCHPVTVTPGKSQILSLFSMPPLLLSTLAPKWAVLTLKLCPQHCAHYSYMFHIKIPPQHISVQRDVMLDAVIYGKDCKAGVVKKCSQWQRGAQTALVGETLGRELMEMKTT